MTKGGKVDLPATSKDVLTSKVTLIVLRASVTLHHNMYVQKAWLSS